MMERREIVALWRESEAEVLVTLVRAEGSSYRQPGARLLLGRKGRYAGTISGGCLEAEVARKAGWLTRNGATVQHYSTLFDDTAEIPFGLGCGGAVDLLLEPMATPEADALMHALANSLDGRRSTVVSFLPGPGRSLRRLVLDAQGEVVFASEGLPEAKVECARGLTPGVEYEGHFVERIDGPQRLIVLGAGDDAKPLTSFAATLGWTVIVADGRAHLARAERFPAAERVLVANDTEELQIREDDAVVLMTHSYEQDRAWLANLLGRTLAPRYVGLLGSRHRSSLLVSEAAAMTGRTVATCCGSLYAPVGLDLGGDGPEAIALAIVAEVQAHCHGRLTSSRKLTPEEVDAQVAQGGAVVYLQCELNAG
jgi:xanthine dehydrogenase accessory factor